MTWQTGAAARSRDGADAHAVALRGAREGRRSAGQLSLWWTEAPALPGERLGAIGHFGAEDEAAARALLDAAAARLREAGCTLGVGPMDGNTWRRYRLVTEPGAAPPFFLEPWNPPEWPGYWERAGFEPLARYVSVVLELDGADAGRAAAAEAALEARGVALRPLDLAALEAELVRIHEVSKAAFQAAFLYTPLPQGAFLAQYRRLGPLLRPGLSFLAEREGELLGFVFAVPDRLEAERGAPAETAVAKTIAVRPEWAGQGLGTALLARAHAAARAAGFRRVVHALLHEGNRSRRLGGARARPLRGYTLYARRLPR